MFSRFKNEIDSEKFFKYLNSKYPNIKFTIEKETSKFLPFLNVLVINEGRTFTTSVFTTSVYRKKTFIGVFLHCSSFTPFSYKIILLNCLIYRAFKISSTSLIFHGKINKIKNILQKNMHPMFAIDNKIKRFLEMQYTTMNIENTINN